MPGDLPSLNKASEAAAFCCCFPKGERREPWMGSSSTEFHPAAAAFSAQLLSMNQESVTHGRRGKRPLKGSSDIRSGLGLIVLCPLSLPSALHGPGPFPVEFWCLTAWAGFTRCSLSKCSAASSFCKSCSQPVGNSCNYEPSQAKKL